MAQVGSVMGAGAPRLPAQSGLGHGTEQHLKCQLRLEQYLGGFNLQWLVYLGNTLCI